ncbi:MAG: hypothetical protein BWY26_00037 [Elusimicrobia bacterium ADurb.Bin231]|nr:MAG: hypothetical protein BWY26_00037 [Elusimicrobia bacterium ADurb.Bin231]
MESIPVYLERINQILNNFKQKGCATVTTADIIRQYSGGFFSNRDVSPVFSFNAQFGKLLKRNMRNLGISEARSNVPINDDQGHPTCTSEWKLL